MFGKYEYSVLYLQCTNKLTHYDSNREFIFCIFQVQGA